MTLRCLLAQGLRQDLQDTGPDEKFRVEALRAAESLRPDHLDELGGEDDGLAAHEMNIEKG